AGKARPTALRVQRRNRSGDRKEALPGPGRRLRERLKQCRRASPPIPSSAGATRLPSSKGGWQTGSVTQAIGVRNRAGKAGGRCSGAGVGQAKAIHSRPEAIPAFQGYVEPEPEALVGRGLRG